MKYFITIDGTKEVLYNDYQNGFVSFCLEDDIDVEKDFLYPKWATLPCKKSTPTPLWYVVKKNIDLNDNKTTSIIAFRKNDAIFKVISPKGDFEVKENDGLFTVYLNKSVLAQLPTFEMTVVLILEAVNNINNN